ncbi:galactose-1-phosphate uridylyltransferase [Euzebya tangerina]|uniref:galactose-1-phosphate uridylyltransferase n=1 Tax=Euzebya tangerina TaxID=591198 RepID=UPI000E31EFF8|nr:galactose-1-phosphate uridylyltransferase [Euzebya tangerina]
MKRTQAVMADGRELFYFDRDESQTRTAVDERDLPDVASSIERRLDISTGDWVAITAHRQSRTFKPSRASCPLCASAPGSPTEIPEPYDVVVFENRFPSFVEGAEAAETAPDGPYAVLPGNGRCEVVCFTDDHDTSFGELSPASARLVIDAWADRTADLSQIETVEHVFPFENRGEEIGVTLSHPHGQIYAYPFIPPRMAAHMRQAREHHHRTGRNLFADILAGELADGRRIIATSECFTAFVPHAARWPVEVHLYPNRRVADFTGLTDVERDDLAVIYLDILGRLDRMYDAPLPYIAGWVQAPVRRDRDLGYLHLELVSIRRSADKLKYLAGSESAMGAFINDVAPEAAAERLRELAT